MFNEDTENLARIDPKKNDPFVGHKFSTQMKVNGELSCTLNMPKALEKKIVEGQEYEQRLPPYNPRAAFVVEEYEFCPVNWMHGSSRSSSYFVPIQPEHGMWLDFNANHRHTHDVAILISIQGLNPLTGKKTGKLRLEKYKDACPVHEKPFGQDRYCEECKYKWPPQNYLSTTGQPTGQLWLDGFMAADGVVRQYIFTEEESKGVAAQVLGEDRVFAIGIAFFLSKQPKPEPKYDSYGYYPISSNACWGPGVGASDYSLEFCSAPGSPKYMIPPKAKNVKRLVRQRTNSTKNVEIGAGAKINQRVYEDPKELDYWGEEPYLIYVNYCDVLTALDIIKAGKRKTKENGFLSDLELAK